MESQIEIKSLNELEILDNQELGFGYISKVKMAKHRATGQSFAVKIVS